MAEYLLRRWAEGGDDVDFEAEVTDAEFALLLRLEKACESFEAVYGENEDLYFRILNEANAITRAELLEWGDDPDSCNFGVEFFNRFDIEGDLE